MWHVDRHVALVACRRDPLSALAPVNVRGGVTGCLAEEADKAIVDNELVTWCQSDFRCIWKDNPSKLTIWTTKPHMKPISGPCYHMGQSDRAHWGPVWYCLWKHRQCQTQAALSWKEKLFIHRCSVKTKSKTISDSVPSPKEPSPNSKVKQVS